MCLTTLTDWRKQHPTGTIIIAIVLAFLIILIIAFVSIKLLDENMLTNGRVFAISCLIAILYCTLDGIIALLMNSKATTTPTA